VSLRGALVGERRDLSGVNAFPARIPRDCVLPLPGKRQILTYPARLLIWTTRILTWTISETRRTFIFHPFFFLRALRRPYRGSFLK